MKTPGKPLSMAFAVISLALYAAVAYDASRLTRMLGMPLPDGEGIVAGAGLALALATSVFGLRGLWRPRLTSAA